MAEQRLSGDILSALEKKGFALRPFTGYVRLVRGYCEIHLKPGIQADPGFVMEIPVLRLGPGRPLSPLVASYLEERNRTRKGPGTFTVHGDIIWYKAAADQDATPDALAGIALAMQETVERIGPKILNMLR